MEILLVDDSAADTYLTKLALNEALPDSRVRVVEDGEQALGYLDEIKNSPTAIPPDLIVLDLNMPRLDGFSVLTHLKAMPEYRSTPVIILTTSTWQNDINRAYRLGALKYFSKPSKWEDYITLGSSIAALWNQWRTGVILYCWLSLTLM
jgi:chemotaxis family two-component system response regulator Rcp1